MDSILCLRFDNRVVSVYDAISKIMASVPLTGTHYNNFMSYDLIEFVNFYGILDGKTPLTFRSGLHFEKRKVIKQLCFDKKFTNGSVLVSGKTMQSFSTFTSFKGNRSCKQQALRMISKCCKQEFRMLVEQTTWYINNSICSGLGKPGDFGSKDGLEKATG
ncbi:hypothetical protein MTR_4g008850 [Medicago truncatula]|uniref:Uncharacterized protein n=1 Tax=Medicago truncatula TaxID=3880 RepID=A0A072UGT7_MEDTR|nr:hypothetical protein MTR_4g008850 [Medicago truncatula]